MISNRQTNIDNARITSLLLGVVFVSPMFFSSRVETDESQEKADRNDVRKRTLTFDRTDWCISTIVFLSYSRFLVRHHWFVLSLVVVIAIVLTIIGVLCTQLPDFSDPRKVNRTRRSTTNFFLVFSSSGMGSTWKGHDLFAIDGFTTRVGEISSCL